ncbi:Uncharacterised protein r2_g2252 [Pycnogonum litorale]
MLSAEYHRLLKGLFPPPHFTILIINGASVASAGYDYRYHKDPAFGLKHFRPQQTFLLTQLFQSRCHCNKFHVRCEIQDHLHNHIPHQYIRSSKTELMQSK